MYCGGNRDIRRSKLLNVGLAWHTNDATLHTKVEEFGTAGEATVIKDRDTSRTRGFRFLRFSQGYEAGQAIENMNKVEFDR
ncbi:uncharacterized protein BDZ99DRAFT_525789 [Mytilinidion resinicola]|uniref:RRM domain-containing protein n=1 Tax=Mytilinidion resinicola TaxID=574789 RepID=A0A6A6Y6P6_9PEZI|nr:uncharacterized protein BDZ99DRAFT_525789 [Mytilinidion resinicola]KAF2804198.1 hypothetical protein BDZ99DRAFT_525789 [Mytilinidion resinicola]